MAIIMGPVLKFVGIEEDEQRRQIWHVSALVVTDGDRPVLSYKYLQRGPVSVKAEPPLRTYNDKAVHRYSIKIPRGNEEIAVTYSIAGGARPDFTFRIPGIGQQLNMSYASCNGFSEPGLMKDVSDHFAMWNNLIAYRPEADKGNAPTHTHLLLLGGDQVYADSIWTACTDLGYWSSMDNNTANAAPFDDGMREETENFYFQLYCDRWRWPKQATKNHFSFAFATTPTLMMWDDHDILDGWGSYSKERNECPVFEGIFKEGKRNFSLFQQQEWRESELMTGGYFNQTDNFSFMQIIDDVGILALDLRSERTPTQVMSRAQWDQIYGTILNPELPRLRHLLVMSSIPDVHADFSLVESAMHLWPGRQELEDDLLDHWNSEGHCEERLRLVKNLFEFSRMKDCRVTLLSGDVHIGALGIIENLRDNAHGRSAIINQLTSSGIVHPPPSGLARLGIEKMLASGIDEITQGITAKLVPPGAGKRLFIGSRNWLSMEIEPTETGRIWAKWHAESEPEMPRTKVIHPVQAEETKTT